MNQLETEEASAPPQRTLAEVLENRAEGGAARRLVLRVPGWPPFRPGQFVMLSPGVQSRVPRFDPLLPRPMALFRASGSAQQRTIEILYSVVGRGTSLLADAQPGSRVRVVGPLGRAFPAVPAGGRAVLVGGGTGVASLYELARRGAERGPISVLLGAASRSGLMGLRHFEKLEAQLHVTTEDGSAGHRGLVTDLLEELLAGAAVVYACGPTGMMRRCAEIAARHSVRCYVSLENTMACGIGICLGCALPNVSGSYSLVCCDGPVFDAAQVAWKELP